MKRIRSERDEVKNITASSLKKRKEEFLKNRENLLKEKIVKK